MTEKKTGEEVDRDLFGAPISQIRDRWGRPSFKKTKENQQLVAALKAADYSQAAIAAVIGCDEKTLRKNFSRELAHGPKLIDADALAVLLRKMHEGSVSAAKEIRKIVNENAPVPHVPDPVKKKPEELGKKDQLRLDADQPQGSWGSVLN